MSWLAEFQEWIRSSKELLQTVPAEVVAPVVLGALAIGVLLEQIPLDVGQRL